MFVLQYDGSWLRWNSWKGAEKTDQCLPFVRPFAIGRL